MTKDTDTAALVEQLRSVDISWSETGELCAEAAATITALQAQIATVQRAAKTIMIHEADELTRLRDERHMWHQAVSSLDSERAANALLTDENERLQARVGKLEDRLKFIAETPLLDDEYQDIARATLGDAT